MCGITGIVSNHSHKDKIAAMSAALIHRGPDDEGFFHDPAVALGQRRLSIIDLDGGRQPISNEEGTLQLVCNGEIYNSPELRSDLEKAGHRFRTRTDVEAILHLYEDHGRNCVRKLRGMFAFALWDGRQRCLLLARDHMGQKPLFFADQGDVLLFASEIKAIFASGLIRPQMDLDALWHYVSLRFLPDRYTFFKGIQKLPAATTLMWRDGRFDLERYWTPDFREKLPGSIDEITDQLEHVLRQSVTLHLLSDVPVGTFLSGGIDSSLVSAMASQATGARIPAFSVGVKDERFNELPFARKVVQHCKLEGHERIVDPDLVQILPRMIRHLDEPSDPFGFGVYLVSQLAAEKVKVVLGGDGGDENFAGYDRFAGQHLVDLYCAMPVWFRRHIMTRLIQRIPESFAYKSLAQKAAWLNDMSFYTAGERYAQSMSFLRFTMEAKERLFRPEAKRSLTDPNSIDKILRHYDSHNVEELVDRMLYTDLMTRMPDHLLSLVDRMSMAHSLENRSPLVDHKVVEFAARIPGAMKLKGRNLKYILKKVAARYLPRDVITRPKQGFSFPVGTWMRGQLKQLMDNIFKQSRFVEQKIFDGGEMQRMWNEHVSGKADHNYRLWILLNLELWHRLYFEGETADSLTDTILALSNHSN